MCMLKGLTLRCQPLDHLEPVEHHHKACACCRVPGTGHCVRHDESAVAGAVEARAPEWGWDDATLNLLWRLELQIRARYHLRLQEIPGEEEVLPG